MLVDQAEYLLFMNKVIGEQINMDTTTPPPYPEPVSNMPTRIPYALHKGRVTLRVLSTILAVIALILDIAGSVECNDPNNYDDGYCLPVVGIITLPIILTWNIAEFITLCVNKKGIHPGAHIALDLLICAGLATSGTFDLFWAGELTRSAGVLEVNAAAFHLILFILACISVHKWRKKIKGLLANPQVIVVQQQPMTGSDNAALSPMPIVTTSVHPYASLPPPPPGMAYLVPIPQAAEVLHQQQEAPRMVGYMAPKDAAVKLSPRHD